MKQMAASTQRRHKSRAESNLAQEEGVIPTGKLKTAMLLLRNTPFFSSVIAENQLFHLQKSKLHDTSKKSPMQLINEVPPIKVEDRIVACEGGSFFFLVALIDMLPFIMGTETYSSE
ncbi:NADH dehydrogenase [ubiquinone] iron-sulfur protein 6, mitochondrial-like protein [Drosera capensis]